MKTKKLTKTEMLTRVIALAEEVGGFQNLEQLTCAAEFLQKVKIKKEVEECEEDDE